MRCGRPGRGPGDPPVRSAPDNRRDLRSCRGEVTWQIDSPSAKCTNAGADAFRFHSPTHNPDLDDVRPFAQPCSGPFASPHADDGAVPAHQGRVSGHAGVLPHGRLLRAVLRRCAQGAPAARHHADHPRRQRRRAGGHGRRAGAFGRGLPGAADQAGRGRGRGRTGGRRGHRQGSGGTQGGARGHARHRHRQRTDGRARRHAAAGAAPAQGPLRSGLAGAVQRPARPGRMRRARAGLVAGAAGPGRDPVRRPGAAAGRAGTGHGAARRGRPGSSTRRWAIASCANS